MHRSIKQHLAGRTKVPSQQLLLLHAYLKSLERFQCKMTSNSIQNKQQAKSSSSKILSTMGIALHAKLLILQLKLR